jgi:hypothetical protein
VLANSHVGSVLSAGGSGARGRVRERDKQELVDGAEEVKLTPPAIALYLGLAAIAHGPCASEWLQSRSHATRRDFHLQG